MRLDVASGDQAEVAWSTYTSDRVGRPRMFLPQGYQPEPFRNGGGATPAYVFSNRPGMEMSNPEDHLFELHRDGDRFVVDYAGGSGPVTIRLAGVDRPVRLRAPRGNALTETDPYWIRGWLDDTQVIVAGDSGDLMLCPLPDGRCRIAVENIGVLGFQGRG